MVRELFVMAREHAPSIIFMDEIDSIGSSRLEGGSGGDSEVQRTMLELLNQLDGFEATKNIKVRHPRLAVSYCQDLHSCCNCQSSVIFNNIEGDVKIKKNPLCLAVFHLLSCGPTLVSYCVRVC